MQQGPTTSGPPGLPQWRSVLAVVAHPDDESFGLGAVLAAFARAGTQTSVLCLTHGEASTVRGLSGDLATLRSQEFMRAARRLGVGDAQLRDYPDGALERLCVASLTGEVLDTARSNDPDGLLVFDPSAVTGHPDHGAATRAALLAATAMELPILAWTIPSTVATRLNNEFASEFTGHQPEDIDITLSVNRDSQMAAVREHESQAIPTSVLWRRLELLGHQESLRWLDRTDVGSKVST